MYITYLTFNIFNFSQFLSNFSAAWINVEQGTFSELHTLTLNEWTAEDGISLIRSKGSSMNVSIAQIRGVYYAPYQ